MNTLQLGFGPSPRPRKVFVSEDKSETGWYFWNKAADRPDPIGEDALVGYVTKVETHEKEYNGKPVKKLHVHVAAGARNYIIEVGFYTAFARSLLAALVRLRPEHFQKPLAIETRAGEQKVMFAEVFNAENGLRIKGREYPQQESEVDTLFAKVQETLAKQPATTPASAPRAAAAAPATGLAASAQQPAMANA